MENLKYYLDYYFGNKFINVRNIYYDSMFTNYGDECGVVAIRETEYERLSKQEGIIVVGDKTLISNQVLLFVSNGSGNDSFKATLLDIEQIATIVAYYKKVPFNNTFLEQFIKDSESIIVDMIKSLKLRVFKNKKRDLAEQVDQINRTITRAKEQLSNSFNQLRVAQATSFDGYLEKASANLDKEITLIKNHKKVESISVEGDRFVINTVYLYITEPTSSKRFNLGKMSIKIPLATGTSVKIINNTGTRYGYWERSQHPHVASDGSPCFGNIEMGVFNYTTEEQYYALFLLLLNYLECVDIEDCAGAKILAWDEINEDNEIIVEGIPRKSWAGRNTDELNHPFGVAPPIEPLEEGQIRCEDCGCTVAEYNAYTCEDCGVNICEDCACHTDGDIICNSCYNNRQECNDDYDEEDPEDF